MVLISLALAAAVLLQDEWAEFHSLARDPDPDKRCQAIEKIKAHANLRMVRALLPLLADPHARVRRRAARAMEKVRETEGIDYLDRAGLAHSHPRVRALCAKILGEIPSPSSVPRLVSLLLDAHAGVRTAACEALGRLDARGVVEKLEQRCSADASWSARAAALEALSKLDPSRAAAAARKAVPDRAYQVRLMAARVAPVLDYRPVAVSVLQSGLRDSDWRVRVQAVESAVEIRDRETIEPLVDLLTTEKGRLRWDAYLALRDLTGKELGSDGRTWKAWWEANRDTFQVPARGGPAGESVRGDSGVAFFNVPIFSSRIVFVLDLSGSMRDPAPAEKGSAAQSKLDVAKQEMARTIRSLPETTGFNLVLLGCERDGRYPKDEKRWQRSLVAATPKVRTEAVSFLQRQEARGWTNIWDGLELAFEDGAVDTVYLYTDGGASRGTFVASTEILEELRIMNTFRKIMIHTIEVPSRKPNPADNVRLLKNIAEATKGMYQMAK
ncbi:MAG: HEAT repeat domain-containing protein [Planctomycetes bacterium]|nr:HEAT repeat domain-containing protein [Planctomycetota bacterium]